MGGGGLGRRGSFNYGVRDPYLDGPRGRRRSFDDGYGGGSMGMIGGGGGMMGGGSMGMMGGGGSMGMMGGGGTGMMGGGYPGGVGMYEDDYRRGGGGGGGRDGNLSISRRVSGLDSLLSLPLFVHVSPAFYRGTKTIADPIFSLVPFSFLRSPLNRTRKLRSKRRVSFFPAPSLLDSSL